MNGEKEEKIGKELFFDLPDGSKGGGRFEHNRRGSIERRFLFEEKRGGERGKPP